MHEELDFQRISGEFEAGGLVSVAVKRPEMDARNSGTDIGSLDAGLWATPAACVPNLGEKPDTWLARAAKLKERHGNGNGAGMPLSIQAQMAAWGTPRVSRGQYMSGKDGEKLLTLEGQLATWPTPNASDGSGGPCNLESRKGHSMQLVDYLGQHPHGCLAPMESFVERLMNLSMWLMGYTAVYLRLWETASCRKSRAKS